MTRFTFGVITVFLGAMSASAADPSPSYTKDVVPIIDKYCLECHVGKKPKGGYDLSSTAKMFEAGGGSAAVVPGKPEISRMYLTMTAKGGPLMPPRDYPARPTAQDIAIIRKWITDGAKDDTPKENPK